MVVLWSVNACEKQAATLLLWRGREGVAPIQAAPYRCGSWRCNVCSWAVAREDYRRVEHAAFARDRWLYAVLTFNPADFADRETAFVEAGRLWDKRLRRKLERRYGRVEYLQTWERHVSGWPHLNLLFRSDALYDAIDSRMPFELRPVKHSKRGRHALFTRFRRVFRTLAMDSGFGPMVWLEGVEAKHRDAMACYLTKVSHELTSSASKSGDQRPFDAPPHFRRIRASRGLLPPRMRIAWERKVDAETGEESWELVERRLDKPGPWTGILSPQSLQTFSNRAPTWTDVADAMWYQAAVAAKRSRRRCSTAS